MPPAWSSALWVVQGFKIIFEFSDNPFFSNKELVKTYYMVSDDVADPVLQKATATSIQWASGKNPGVKVNLPWSKASCSVCVYLQCAHSVCMKPNSLQHRPDCGYFPSQSKSSLISNSTSLVTPTP